MPNSQKPGFLRSSLILTTLCTLAVSTVASGASKAGTPDNLHAEASTSPSAQLVSNRSKQTRSANTKQSSSGIERSDGSVFFARIAPNVPKFGGAPGVVRYQTAASGLWISTDGRFATTATGVTQDFDSFCRRYERRCGRYQVSGNQITMRRNSQSASEAETKTISYTATNIVIGDTTYYTMPLLQGYTFSGSYRRLMSPNSSKVTHFSKDGGLRITSRSRTSNSRIVRNGRYRINDHTITYIFDDGERETQSFYFLDGEPFIDGDWYKPAE